MRNSTSRALRATATVAGVAALGATFAGTAFADSGFGGLGGSDNGYGSSGDSQGLSDFGGSNGSSIIDEPGLANFEMPGMGMGSKGFRTDGPEDFFGSGNSFSGPWGDSYGDDDNYGGSHYRGRHHDSDDNCGDEDRSHRRGSRSGFDQFQNPVQCKDNNFLKGINFDGHEYGDRDHGFGRNDWDSSYKSIGSRNFRTSDNGFGGFGGGDMFGGGSGDSDYGNYGDSDYGSKIYSHGGSTSRNHDDGDDSDFGGSGDGLSGHTFKLPIGG